jgi:hypothetical protein
MVTAKATVTAMVMVAVDREARSKKQSEMRNVQCEMRMWMLDV